MEGAVLGTLSFLENINFGLILELLGVGLVIFWLVVIGWVVFDSAERYTSFWARAFSVLLVIGLPLFGLFIYLIIRPRSTREEDRWMDLERRFLKFEASGLEDCHTCGYELMPNYVYCPNCGSEHRVKCSSCEVYIEPLWRTCPYCGTLQSRSTARDTESVREKKGVGSKKEPSTPIPVVKTRRTGALKKLAEEADGFIRYIGRVPLQKVARKRKKKNPAKLSPKDTEKAKK